MKNVKPKKWSVAYKTADFISIVTHSGYRGSAIEIGRAYCIVPATINERDLGIAAQECLGKSRFLSLEQIPDFFELGRLKRDHDLWIDELMQKHGFKTKRALFKSMLSCNLTISDDVLTIEPTVHEKLEGWSGRGEEETIVLPADSSPGEVGAAIRAAFERCA
ncbi:contact-dependent growth inhibition system immunity protein [Microvirga lotononidis]|uniref:contact-dependent growth inhibition system immunity protein n=1 Tax=Microvirga lotononidis TaxID=864069 RepID=UPI000A03FC7B|nr:contact-dependent growth inhibition system immunity protein [Microvirga lotononidis]WQO28945.1 contact-dependent growth inhibition system immunity protein [Microvirga lotononidis]